TFSFPYQQSTDSTTGKKSWRCLRPKVWLPSRDTADPVSLTKRCIRLKTTIARLISILGHPFLTVPLFVVFLLFSTEPTVRATYLSLLIIGGIFLPIGLKTIRGVRKGTYTNLDVSDQVQRQKWFIATTMLLLVVTIVIWLTNQ